MMRKASGFNHASGFTLAELLIALAILGVIATFTIPKIIGSATSGQSSAIAKEAASMVSGAFSVYTLNSSLTTATTGNNLTPYMNYVSVDTTATTYNFGAACNAAGVVCMKLHNGGVLRTTGTASFGGSAATNALIFNLDPDGAGPLTPISFVQYYNGRLTTGGQAIASTTNSASEVPITPDPAYLQNWN